MKTYLYFIIKLIIKVLFIIILINANVFMYIINYIHFTYVCFTINIFFLITLFQIIYKLIGKLNIHNL